MTFIVQDQWIPGGTMYVCARPGWARDKDGSFVRNGSKNGGHEWTKVRAHALHFKSHRAAACALSRSGSSRATIIEEQP